MRNLLIVLTLLAVPMVAAAGDTGSGQDSTPFLDCTAGKAGKICVATVAVAPLQAVTLAPATKVCRPANVTRSETPIGITVQDHGCGVAGVYNPTLKPRQGTVIIYYDYN